MRLKLKIGSKILLTGGATILALLLTIFIVVDVQLNTGISKLVGDQLTTLATSMADYTETRIQGDIRSAIALAHSASLIAAVEAENQGGAKTSAGKAAIDQDLKDLASTKEFNSAYKGIILAGTDGQVFAASDPAYIGASMADREYFMTASQGTANVSQLIVDKVTNIATVAIAAPVQSRGKTIGVVTLFMKTTEITDEMAKFSLGKSGYFIVYDKTGLVVQHPDATVMLKTNITALAGMEDISKKALSGAQGYASYVFKGVKKTGAYSTVPSNGWVVMPQMTSSEFLATATAIQRIILIVGAIALLVAMAILYALSRSISKPIGDCVKYAGLIESGDLSRPVRDQFLERQDEIGDLAQAFKGMSPLTRMRLASRRRGVCRNATTRGEPRTSCRGGRRGCRRSRGRGC